MLSRSIFLTIVLSLTNFAHANDSEDSDDRKVVYKSKTEIDFEGLEVDALVQKPQSQLILERKKASFNPLVKIRTEWNDEIEESIDEAK